MKSGSFYEGRTDVVFVPNSPHREIEKILEKIFPVWEELALFMKQVYLTMTEQVQKNTIVVLSGGPNSGRTVIKTLIKTLFEDRVLVCPGTIFEAKPSAIINLPVSRKTKLLITQDNTTLNHDVISAITSGKQAFREIHQFPIKKQLNIWCFVDEVLPTIDPKIKIIHIPFRSTFGDVTKSDEFLFKKDPCVTRNIRSHINSFMNLALLFRCNTSE